MTELMPLMSYCLVMSGTPGPNNVMLTLAGANFGYRSTLPTILGILTGGFVLAAACCLGLGSLFQSYPVAQQTLRLTGSAYLIWLAWKISRSSLGEAQAASSPPGFVHGALFQIVNPKTWLKSITLASVFMPPGMSPWMAALWVPGIGTVIGFPAISMWALFGMGIRQALTRPAAMRAFNLTMGGTLVVLALMILARR